METCKNCGAPLQEGTKFCGNCGSRVEVEEQAPMVVQEPMSVAEPEPMSVVVPEQQTSYHRGTYNQIPPNHGQARKSSNKAVFIIVGIFIFLVSLCFLGGVVFYSFVSEVSQLGSMTSYDAIEVSSGETSMPPEEYHPDGIQLDLFDDGSCVFVLGEEVYDGEWETEGNSFVMTQGDDTYHGILEGDTLVISNVLSLGYDITFLEEGGYASIPEPSSSGDSDNMLEGSTGISEEREVIPTPSDWYGIVNISNYSGPTDISGGYETWGYLGTDAMGDYFELYTIAPYDSEDANLIMSFYIDLHEDTFYPIVNDDGWMYNYAPLREEDATLYYPTYEDGRLSATYEYDYNGENFTMHYMIEQED